MTTSSKQTIDRNLVEDTTGNKPGAKATAAKDGEDMNVATQWMLGYGNKSQFVIQNQTVDGIKTFGNDLPIVSKEGTPYGAISTIQDITKSQYTGILDWTNASIGGQKLNPETMNQVLTALFILQICLLIQRKHSKERLPQILMLCKGRRKLIKNLEKKVF